MPSPQVHTLAISVCLLLLTVTGSSESKTKLHILTLTPFHCQEVDQFGWDGGPALVPAARLAAKEINKREDILPDHELVLVEESISCHFLVERQVRLLNMYARQVIYANQNFVGIVGPACSVNAEQLGHLGTPSRNPLVQVGIATDPHLASRDDYPFVFSTLSSGARFLVAMKQLALQEDWKSIGVILDVTSTYWVSLNSFVPRIFTNINVTIFNVADGENFESFVGFRLDDEIVQSRLRVFIVLLSRNTADHFMCLLYKRPLRLVYPTLQLFFIERSTLLNPNSDSRCTDQELTNAFENTVFLQYKLDTVHTNKELVSGRNYTGYMRDYKEEVCAYENDTGLNILEDYLHGSPYAPVFYDATWALGLSLDRVVREGTIDFSAHREPGSADNLQLAKAIQESILSLDRFYGASGIIKFNNETGQTDTVITFTQVLNGELVIVGTSEGPVNGTFISDGFRKASDGIETWVASIVLILVGLLFMLTLFLHILTVFYSKEAAVKATSPRLNNLIFVGCYLVLLGMVLITVVVHAQLRSVTENFQVLGDALCNIYIWLVDIGVTLIVATVLMKTFRIYRIFVHFTQPGGCLLQDSSLALGVLGLLVPVFIVLITISGFSILSAVSGSPNNTHFWREEAFLSGLTEYTRAMCVVDIWQEIAPKVYVASLLLVSLTLSLPLRHINPHFRTIKSISIMAFLQTLLTWIGYPLVFICIRLGVAWDKHVGYLLLMSVWGGILLSSLLLLFAPPLVPILRKRWEKPAKHSKGRRRSSVWSNSTRVSVTSYV